MPYTLLFVTGLFLCVRMSNCLCRIGYYVCQMSYYVCKIAFVVCRIGCGDVWGSINIERLTVAVIIIWHLTAYRIYLQ